MLGFLYSASMPIFFISVRDMLAADRIAFPPQHVAQHPAAGKRMFQMQFVDPAHQRQVRFAGFLRPVVGTSSAPATEAGIAGTPAIHGYGRSSLLRSAIPLW